MEPEICGPVHEQECTPAQGGHLDPELWGVLPVLEQVTSGFGSSFTERTNVINYRDGSVSGRCRFGPDGVKTENNPWPADL